MVGGGGETEEKPGFWRACICKSLGVLAVTEATMDGDGGKISAYAHPVWSCSGGGSDRRQQQRNGAACRTHSEYILGPWNQEPADGDGENSTWGTHLLLVCTASEVARGGERGDTKQGVKDILESTRLGCLSQESCRRCQPTSKSSRILSVFLAMLGRYGSGIGALYAFTLSSSVEQAAAHTYSSERRKLQ
ncbi:hypothetical protein HYPSUDRAFT_59612 [Hypholoma sublateritium FD-334 SS-4]|uniref:Uncharacterized protein n=1 Tax=Hypholoma sublateritium (strain FD-334 SS-4) TaxID=945553 RepID=A0A0D2NZW5_HYPSF|nr:hypothetical protein HYPSUDRAFT_59612 [Hypholoma sublateritium FD-334 SS-4]